MNRLPAFASIPDPLLATESSGTRSAPPLPSLRVVTFGAAGTRQDVRRRQLLAVAASLGWLLVHLRAYGLRTDWDALTAGYAALELALPLLLAIGAGFAALWPGRFGLRIGVRASAAWAVLSPLAFWLAALFGAVVLARTARA